LIDWLRGFHREPGHTFIMHGEPSASERFAQAIKDQLGWANLHLPKRGEQITL
jgi:metallo-beta-lactamase family protein